MRTHSYLHGRCYVVALVVSLPGWLCVVVLVVCSMLALVVCLLWCALPREPPLVVCAVVRLDWSTLLPVVVCLSCVAVHGYP